MKITPLLHYDISTKQNLTQDKIKIKTILAWRGFENA